MIAPSLLKVKPLRLGPPPRGHAKTRAGAAVDALRKNAPVTLGRGGKHDGKTTSRNPANAAKRYGDRRSSTRQFRFCF